MVKLCSLSSLLVTGFYVTLHSAFHIEEYQYNYFLQGGKNIVINIMCFLTNITDQNRNRNKIKKNFKINPINFKKHLEVKKIFFRNFSSHIEAKENVNFFSCNLSVLFFGVKFINREWHTISTLIKVLSSVSIIKESISSGEAKRYMLINTISLRL